MDNGAKVFVKLFNNWIRLACKEVGFFYVEEPGRQRPLIFDQGNRISQGISCVDVADICVKALHDSSTRNKSFDVWNNIHMVCRDQPDLMHLAGKLSNNLKYCTRRRCSIALVNKCLEPSDHTCSNAVKWKEPDDVPAYVNPWDDGVCKACGIDKDDDKVLLCDTCDSEYHTYCLNPPLASIPEGNWNCPLCVVVQGQSEVALTRTHVVNVQKPKRYQEKDILTFSEN